MARVGAKLADPLPRSFRKGEVARRRRQFTPLLYPGFTLLGVTSARNDKQDVPSARSITGEADPCRRKALGSLVLEEFD